MKSYEEVVCDVFRKGDQRIQKKRKRIAAVRNVCSVMSMLGIFTLVGLEIFSSPSDKVPLSNVPGKIEIMEVHTVIQTVTEISLVTTETAVNVNTATDSPMDNSSFHTTQPAFTNAPVKTSASEVIKEETKTDDIPSDFQTESNISLESVPESVITSTTETETTAEMTSSSSETSSATQSEPLSDVMDVNGDGVVDILDVIYVLNYYAEVSAGLR